MAELETLTSKKLYISQRLIRDLSEAEAKEFGESYKRARKVLNKINSIAQKEAAGKLNNIESPKAFELNNWPYYVAWNAGYRQAMRMIQDLTRYEKV
jgi:hypothetical protein